MRVEVYRNLQRNCWSVRDLSTGRVVAHPDSVIVADARFVVRPSGRARVLAEKRKNVHAFVRGEWVRGMIKETIAIGKDSNRTPHRVSYNPYKHPYFYNVETEEAVTSSAVVHLDSNGKVQARL